MAPEPGKVVLTDEEWPPRAKAGPDGRVALDRCPQCGKRDKVAKDIRNLDAICGRCGADMGPLEG